MKSFPSSQLDQHSLEIPNQGLTISVQQSGLAYDLLQVNPYILWRTGQ